jgi:cell division protein FtsI/penicillin-binding protein 2
MNRLLSRLVLLMTATRPLWRRWGTIGLIAVGLAALTLGAAFSGRLAENRNWAKDPPVAEASDLPGILFNKLREAGLVWVEGRSGRVVLRYASCENSIRRLPEEVPPNLAQSELDAMLVLICRSPQGDEVRNEIDQWNQSFNLVAVRDNRALDTLSVPAGVTGPKQRHLVCRNGSTPIGLYVAAGCLPSDWSAELAHGVTAPPARDAVPPFFDFAFIAEDQHLWESDWFRPVTLFPGRATASDGGAATGDQESGTPEQFYRLKTQIAPGYEPLTIDLIGRPHRIILGTAAFDLDATPFTAPMELAAPPYSLRIHILCGKNRDEEYQPRCNTWPGPGVAWSVAITLTGSGRAARQARASAVTLEIDADAMQLPATRSNLRRRTPHIVVDERQDKKACQSAALRPDESCDYELKAWYSPKTVEHDSSHGHYRIVARDGTTDLVDPDTGTITNDALASGLAPIVGLGPADVTSLAAAVDSMPHHGDDTYRLTINPVFQRLVTATIANPCSDGIARTRGRNGKPPCGHHEHHVSVVLMDAGDDPHQRGEVLAMASWPNIDPGLSFWDLAALEVGATSHSPVSGMAWRAVDIGAQPGSSFKAVTALAAIDTVLQKGDPALRELLLGNQDVPTAAQSLRLASSSLRPDQADEGSDAQVCSETDLGKNKLLDFNYNPHDWKQYQVLPLPYHSGRTFRCIRNAESGIHGEFARAYLAPQFTGCATAGPPRIGMCEALITSSNLFFGGLALKIDGKAVVREIPGRDDQERDDAVPELAIRRMASRVFPFPDKDHVTRHSLPGDKQDCGGNPGRGGTSGFDLLRGQFCGEVPKLVANPIDVLAAHKSSAGENRRIDVGLSGYGQSVTATPLAMATAYASIAAQRLVRPRLVPVDADRPERVFDKDENTPLLDVPAGADALYRQLYGQLKRGLAGVAVARAVNRTDKGNEIDNLGTATAVFKDSPLLRPFGSEVLFAKTGTAIIGHRGDRSLYSAWLVGWVEASASGTGRRLAFACDVSPSTVFGAEACGPIMRRILEQLAGSAPPAARRP